jgi:hypothetical protein
MQLFGDLLRKHRRRTQDPLKGGPLTQVRLGELLGHYLGVPVILVRPSATGS